jgi:transcriptional regulator with XRE-family HTH domain
MKITEQIGDELILRELGARLTQQRLDRNLRQAELATEAGISKRTVERMEAGGATQLVNWLRVCRALRLVDRFENLIPMPVESPIAQLKLRSKSRKRASREKPDKSAAKWQWIETP